jgi:hypothetical protein
MGTVDGEGCLKKRTDDTAGSSPPSDLDPDVDQRQLLIARARNAEQLIRTARTRIQGAFTTQASEALDDVRRAHAILGEIATQLIAMGVVETPFLGS